MQALERVSLVDQTTKALIQYIDSDNVTIGDKMPSETVLCAEYKVSRTTIREALRILQASGYVELFQSRGFFVANKKPGGNGDAKSWMMMHAREVLDILEVRSVLEPFAVNLAVKRAKQEELYGIMGLKSLFEEASEKEEHIAMSVYDEKFHEAIVAAARNPFLKGINEVITESLRKFRSKTFLLDARGEKAIGAHAKITGALMERDAEKAEEYMRQHMKTNIEIMKAYLEKQNE
jgi:GntR family transcriptional repressor for pyruvate dehydrogenase complex